MFNGGVGAFVGAEDVSVDVLEISQNQDIKLVAKEDPDATENSSSFADTTSENDYTSGLSDAEVESQFFGDTDLAPSFDGFNSVFPIRKKKLTPHWRNFIHPRDVAMQMDRIENKGIRITSIKVLQRDIQNKRSDLDGVATWEDSDHPAGGHDEFGIQDDSVIPDDNDNNLFEDVLRKIELVHTWVQKLKMQLDAVIINNTAKFSSSENLSQLMACDVQTSSVRSPTFSACNGDTVSAGGLYISSQPLSDYDLGDFIMPDGAVSSFEVAIAIPDIIESTVGLLTSIDVTQNQSQVGDSSEKIVDNILIHNVSAEVEGSTLKNPFNQSAEKTRNAENSGEEESHNEVAGKTVASQEQSTLKSCLASDIHFPKNKRKRGERRAGSSNWSRQRPGETDS